MTLGLTKLCALSSGMLLWTTALFAQEYTPVVTPGSAGTARDTQAYVGIAWQLGKNRTPGARVVVGVRAVEVEDDDVVGLDLNAWFNPNSGIDRIALSGLAGSLSVQLNAGVGYDFAGQQPIVTAAAQAPGVRLGIDYGLSRQKFVPYVELNALGRLKAASASADTLSCATSGYVLVTRDQLTGFGQEIFDFIESEGLDIDGRACLDSSFVLT